MSHILLFQLDGKIPNIALMRIAAHHKALGDDVSFRWTGSPRRELWDNPDRSLCFCDLRENAACG
jgi:hypothetical protein